MPPKHSITSSFLSFYYCYSRVAASVFCLGCSSFRNYLMVYLHYFQRQDCSMFLLMCLLARVSPMKPNYHLIMNWNFKAVLARDRVKSGIFYGCCWASSAPTTYLFSSLHLSASSACYASCSSGLSRPAASSPSAPRLRSAPSCSPPYSRLSCCSRTGCLYLTSNYDQAVHHRCKNPFQSSPSGRPDSFVSRPATSWSSRHSQLCFIGSVAQSGWPTHAEYPPFAYRSCL